MKPPDPVLRLFDKDVRPAGKFPFSVFQRLKAGSGRKTIKAASKLSSRSIAIGEIER
jgi:hypothetical protein